MASSLITAISGQQRTKEGGLELPDNEDVGVFVSGIAVVVRRSSHFRGSFAADG